MLPAPRDAHRIPSLSRLDRFGRGDGLAEGRHGEHVVRLWAAGHDDDDVVGRASRVDESVQFSVQVPLECAGGLLTNSRTVPADLGLVPSGVSLLLAGSARGRGGR
jgi:hypothetical protein